MAFPAVAQRECCASRDIMHYWRPRERGGGVRSASGPGGVGGYLAEKREGEKPYII